MRALVLVAVIAAFLALGQDAPPKAPPQKQPQKTKEQPQKKTVKIYIDVVDFINGKRMRLRATQFIIKEALRIAKLAEKEKFIEQRVRTWKKERKYPKLDEKGLRQKAEHLWFKKRKFFGLLGLDYHHIEILKKPKRRKKPKKSPDEELVPGGEGEKKGGKEEKEPPDPRKIADIIIEGRVDTLRKAPSTFLGEVVTYNAESTSDIKVLDNRTKKAVAEIVKKRKMGAAKHKGQGKAYENAIKAVAEDVAKEILGLDVIRDGARRFQEKTPPGFEEEKEVKEEKK